MMTKPEPVHVLMVSSLFGERKIAEPMGVAILTASLRRSGFQVVIVEPSLEGWTVEKTIEEIARYAPRVIGISMLRDKHADDVHRLVTRLREAHPEAFICVGGHGPSIAVRALPPGTHRPACSGTARHIVKPQPAQPCSSSGPLEIPVNSTVVDPALTDRGKGPGDLSGLSGDAISAESPYFDKSREYLDILSHIDAYVLGEADQTFPTLVGRLIAGQGWHNGHNLAFFDDVDGLTFTPMQPKIDNLDTVPHMARDVYERYLHKYQRLLPASLIATRGCYYRCTFCSVVQYERLQTGPKHRVRSNADVISEMVELYERYGTTEFNFEDDNFIRHSKAGLEMLEDFCERALALPFKIRFSLFCRADSVDERLFGRLTEAGMSGIYFGMESVFEDDLAFFRKDSFSRDSNAALDTLLRLGFSLDVDAERRIMLGYITWHPLASFSSLRATGHFVAKYRAPPKLLRRVLRLYSQTTVVEDVARLGLLDAGHPRGWRFKDSRLEVLEHRINLLFGKVNKRRDQLRTLEKAAARYGYDVPELDRIRKLRLECDDRLYRLFEHCVDTAEIDEVEVSHQRVQQLAEDEAVGFDRFAAEAGLITTIRSGFSACEFEQPVVDLFRK